jgi:hypothetical protein
MRPGFELDNMVHSRTESSLSLVEIAQVVGDDLAMQAVVGWRLLMVMVVAGKKKGFEVLPWLELLKRYTRLTIRATCSVGALTPRKARPSSSLSSPSERSWASSRSSSPQDWRVGPYLTPQPCFISSKNARVVKLDDDMLCRVRWPTMCQKGINWDRHTHDQT